PAARHPDDESAATGTATTAEADVDLGKKMEGARRHPLRRRVALEAARRGPRAAEGHLVVEVRVRAARRPVDRPALADEAARAGDVGDAVVAEDEAEGGDLVDAGEEPADVGAIGMPARDADDVVDGERRARRAVAARAADRHREEHGAHRRPEPARHRISTTIGR